MTPDEPRPPEKPHVLVTGATGYIGGRLVPVLEAAGVRLRCLARQPAALASRVSPTTEVVAGDLLDPASLGRALTGIDVAYYLVHSIGAHGDYRDTDRVAARNFGEAARHAGVRRIVYLGGLATGDEPLSKHLGSRIETGQVLRESGVPVVEFRASVVIGSGSLSFELIRALVERLRVMICPRWVSTLAQPIGIEILTGLTLVWVLSVKLRDASIADVCWGSGFVLLVWLYGLLSPAMTPRSWLVAVLVTVWGARLSLHIVRRNRGQGEDKRYRAMRAAHGPAFWWRSLFTVFWLQGAILWFVALPLLVAVRAGQPSDLTAVDGYFGDATLWWGLYVIAAAVPGGWLTVLSPVLMTFLLMRVSGVTLLEESLNASRPGYRAYVARTPAFFPWRPRVPR